MTNLDKLPKAECPYCKGDHTYCTGPMETRTLSLDEISQQVLARNNRPAVSDEHRLLLDEAILMVKTLRRRLATAKDILVTKCVNTELEQTGINLADEFLSRTAPSLAAQGER